MSRTGKRLRVAFCEERFHSFYGAQQNLLALARAVPRGAIEPLMVTTSEGEFAARCRNAGLRTVILPMAKIANQFGGALLKYNAFQLCHVAIEWARYNLAFWRWLRDQEIDVVICNHVRLALATALGARAAGAQFFIFVQGEMPSRLIAAFAVRVSSGVLIIASALKSNFTKRDQSRYGHKLLTLHTGFCFQPIADAARRRAYWRSTWRIPQDAPVVGLIGSIHPRKGADVLVRAAPKILRNCPGAHFVLVGDVALGFGDFEQQIRGAVAALGLSARWHFAGFIDDMPGVYSTLDVTTLPSRSEGLPGALIESLAYGVPCVSTRVGGVDEIVTHEFLGRMIPVDNPDALASEVIAVLRDEATNPCWRKRRAAEARRRFSIDRYVKQFCGHLQHTFGVRQGRSAN